MIGLVPHPLRGMPVADFFELRDRLSKDVSSFSRVLALQVGRRTTPWAMNKSESSTGPPQPVCGACFWFEKRTPNNDGHGLQGSTKKFQARYIDGS